MKDTNIKYLALFCTLFYSNTLFAEYKGDELESIFFGLLIGTPSIILFSIWLYNKFKLNRIHKSIYYTFIIFIFLVLIVGFYDSFEHINRGPLERCEYAVTVTWKIIKIPFIILLFISMWDFLYPYVKRKVEKSKNDHRNLFYLIVVPTNQISYEVLLVVEEHPLLVSFWALVLAMSLAHTLSICSTFFPPRIKMVLHSVPNTSAPITSFPNATQL